MSTLKTNNIEHLDASSASIQTTSGGGVIFAGISTFQSDANFDANVNIAGTITYEDVTSVDSVGIITANAGIDISNTIVANNDSTIRYDNDTFHVKVDANNVRGSSTFKLDVDDTNAVTIDDNRQIGVGTDNPGERLHLTTTSGNCKLRIDAASAASVDFYNSGTRLSDMFTDASTSNFTITNRSNANIIFRTNGTNERLRIGNDGNCSIGTTTTTNKLRVHQGSDSANIILATGADESSEFISLGIDSGVPTLTAGGVGSTDAELAFRTADNGTESEAARFNKDGRLLVGHTSNLQNQTAQIITSNGAALGLYKFAANDDGAELTFFSSRNATKGSHTRVNNNDYLGRMFFRGSDGDEYHRGAELAIRVDGTPADNDMPGRFDFMTTGSGGTSPATRLTIKASGAILAPDVFDSSTSGSANVIVSSDGRLRNNASSRRFKTDIETLEDSYADNLLENIRPVWFRSKCEGDNPLHGYYGFIAEEVHEIDPRLVIYQETKTVVQEDGSLEHVAIDPIPHAVAYPHFVSPLFNLVKRQKAQIEALEARLTALEAN